MQRNQLTERRNKQKQIKQMNRSQVQDQSIVQAITVTIEKYEMLLKQHQDQLQQVIMRQNQSEQDINQVSPGRHVYLKRRTNDEYMSNKKQQSSIKKHQSSIQVQEGKYQDRIGQPTITKTGLMVAPSGQVFFGEKKESPVKQGGKKENQIKQIKKVSRTEEKK